MPGGPIVRSRRLPYLPHLGLIPSTQFNLLLDTYLARIFHTPFEDTVVRFGGLVGSSIEMALVGGLHASARLGCMYPKHQCIEDFSSYPIQPEHLPSYLCLDLPRSVL